MARDYADEDDASDRSYHRHPSSHHRRRHRRDDSRTSLRYSGPAEEPDLRESRRARVEYYNRSAEDQQRRDSEYRRMAYDKPESPRRKSTRRVREAEGGSGSRRRRHEDRESRRGEEREAQHRRSRRVEDDDRSDEYVYRSRDRRDDESPRRRRTVRHVEADKDLRRSKSTKTPRQTAEEVVVIEESPTRPETAPRAHRSTSVRETSHTYMQTKPASRRNTTTRAREAPATGTVRRVPSVARLSPQKTRRNSTGIFSLFRPAPVYHVPTREKRYECIVCMVDDVPSTRIAKLSCGHNMCHSCLKRQFDLSVTDPQHMPPKCCTAEHIPLKHVDRLFNDKFKMLWNKKYQEYTTKNRIYCPTKGCGEWIKPSNVRMDNTVGRKYARCGKCRNKVCVLCNGKWHTRRECPKDEETKNFQALAKEAGWQRCYNCKAMVELKEGCYHMTCRCTAQFCMLCAAKWKTCTCPWFDHPDLDPGDRLTNMQVPQPYQVNVQTYRDPPTPPSPAQQRPQAAPLRRSNTTTAYAPARRTSIRDSTASGPAEYLSRLFTNPLATFTQQNPTPPQSSRRSNDIALDAYGNAGSHHLNESYAWRPNHVRYASAPVVQPPPAQQQPSRTTSRQSPPAAQSAARRAWLGTSRREKEKEKHVPASVQAGLSKGGGKTGANRVDTWRVHVKFDPEAVRCEGGFVDEVWSESDEEGYIS